MATLLNLKADVYDRLALIEQHQLAIQQLQQEIAELNQQIKKENDLQRTETGPAGQRQES